MDYNPIQRWRIQRDSAIPYISHINIHQPDGSIADFEDVFCEFLWERWLNAERSELVIRSLYVCGYPVDNCQNLVEKSFTVLEWYTKPTKISDLSTGKTHKAGIKSL